jgi:hypothetical protein
VYINTRTYPQGPVTRRGPFTFTANDPTFKGYKDIRVRGRQVSLEVVSEGGYSSWQLGKIRLGIKPNGRI